VTGACSKGTPFRSRHLHKPNVGAHEKITEKVFVGLVSLAWRPWCSASLTGIWPDSAAMAAFHSTTKGQPASLAGPSPPLCGATLVWLPPWPQLLPRPSPPSSSLSVPREVCRALPQGKGGMRSGKANQPAGRSTPTRCPGDGHRPVCRTAGSGDGRGLRGSRSRHRRAPPGADTVFHWPACPRPSPPHGGGLVDRKQLGREAGRCGTVYRTFRLQDAYAAPVE